MTARTVAVSILAATACFASPAAAYEQWQAATRAAKAMTGDIVFRPTLIHFASGASLPLQYAGQVPGLTSMPRGEKARVDLYRVTAPAEPALFRGNSLCGGPVRYLSVAKTDEGIYLSAYYEKPRYFVDGLCAGFQYQPSKRLGKAPADHRLKGRLPGSPNNS